MAKRAARLAREEAAKAPKVAEKPKGEKPWTVRDKSRGLGDVVAKVTHATGIAKVARVVAKVTGRPCGCGGRQKLLNEAVPFTSR